MTRIIKVHLPGELGDPTLCNLKCRRWLRGELVATSPTIVTRQEFDRLPEHERCGRCVSKTRAA
jgi:hypothetical protein